MNVDMSGFAQTVLGPVNAEDLGPTMMHEHLMIDFTIMFQPPPAAPKESRYYQKLTLQNLGWIRYDPFRNRDNLEVLDEDVAVEEASFYRDQGGGSIVDATTIGIGRNPEALARISKATGLNVIMGAGYYVDVAHPNGMDEKTESDLADQIQSDIVIGVGDTGIKAGIIGELGCSWPLTRNECKVLVGAAAAQRSTGATILIHPGRNPRAPFEILDLLSDSGADLSRVVMGHLDRTIDDPSVLLELAARGSCLEFDLFGWETSNYPLSEINMPSDVQRMVFIKHLIDAGYVERIVLAHDVCTKDRQARYGGHGIGHILENVVPRMGAKNITLDEIETMLIKNPARLLAFP